MQYKIIKYKNKTISFIDSYKIINISLANASSIYNISHIKLDIDHSQFILENIHKYDFKTELLTYLKNDVIGLYQILVIFLNKAYDQWGVHNFFTVSGLALKVFLNHYLKFYLENTMKWDNDQIEGLKEGYIGGRTEIFKPFLKSGYYYDVNSLYPTVMKNYDYPIGKGIFVPGPAINLDFFFGFIYCEIESSPSIFIPVLPIKIENLTYFPIGKWKNIYFSEELKLAIKMGYKITPLWGLEYKEKAKIFNNFVSDMYDARIKSKTKDENFFYKLIMNSLYGRFGLKNNNSHFDLQSFDDSLPTNFLYSTVIDNQKIMIERTSNKNYYGFAALHIAFTITSYARIYMYEFITSHNLDKHLYYMDTDSLWLDIPLSDNLVSKTELGKLKLVSKISNAYFINQKIYCYTETRDYDSHTNFVIKGIKENELHEAKNIDWELFLQRDINTVLHVDRMNFFKRKYKDFTITHQLISLDFDLNR